MSVKIVVLDGYTLNPGDISWEGFQKLGDVIVHDRTPDDQIVTRAKGASILLTNKTPLDRNTFDNLSDLKYVGVLATGFNVVDIVAARKHGVIVTNTPGYGTTSVAQMTFALLLDLCNHVKEHSDAVKQGKWAKVGDFCFWDQPLVELAGKTMGIIGFGNIGGKVGDIAAAFGMKIVAYDKNQTDQSHRTDFRWVEIPELLKQSDVVSIHAPLTPENESLINEKTLGLMKKNALLINTARGPIIDEQALAAALNSGKIAGAGLDVLSVEPPTSDNPLLGARNCLTTPHISWATLEARSRLMDIAVNNLRAYLHGNPQNIVN
ncbi:MAG: D-2-hydroxyacid dehydrogenase [Balneolaceae bacterium]|nr:MAG: D-2-hydroxyacid dehydrogenase [Balneolaceae bacterium]